MLNWNEADVKMWAEFSARVYHRISTIPTIHIISLILISIRANHVTDQNHLYHYGKDIVTEE